MRILITLSLVLLMLLIGRLYCSAQPRVFDDLIEFRSNEIITKYTIRLNAPFYITIPKGTRIATVEE